VLIDGLDGITPGHRPASWVSQHRLGVRRVPPRPLRRPR
jgi:hypothetical protein